MEWKQTVVQTKTGGGGGGGREGCAVAQSVERSTPGEEGSIPVVATRSLLVRSVSV